MKYTCILLLMLVSFSASAESHTIEAGKLVKIEKPDFEHCNAEIKNTSSQNLEIAIRDLSCGEIVSKFGLNALGKEQVYIPKNGALFITNLGEKTAKVKVTFEETTAPRPQGNSIEFTLENTSDKSIPLIIPNVMNPNLSPNSKSGVNLKIGQLIYFKYKGKKQILLEVSNSIKSGDTIDVAALIKQKKAEL